VSALVWLAVNGLRWLTIAAVLAWANPWLGPHSKLEPVLAPLIPVRTMQLKPCDPWALTLGRWTSAYVCETWPGAEVRWRRIGQR
jgi:hypothetical protein